MPDTRDERPAIDLWPRRDLLVLLGITVVAAALRLFRIEQWSLSAVEASTWRAVAAPPGGGDSLVFPALRWLFDSGVLPVLREDWLRLPFAFVGILAVPLATLAASRLASRSTSLLAGALLAIHPWHVAVSQTATTRGIALFFAVAAVAAVPRGSATVARPRWLAVVCCLALAVASDPFAWLLVLAGAVLVAVRRWPAASRPARCVMGAACVLLLAASVSWIVRAPAPADAASGAAWLGTTALRIRLPVVSCALVGLLFLRPWPWPPAVVLAVPGCVLAGLALGGRPLDADALVLVLPPLLWLSAHTSERCFVLARGSTGARAGVVAAVVWLGVAGMLATDTFLYATEEQGQRAPWRAAAVETLAGTGEGTEVLAGAAAGADILTCYLRPGHWSERERDPHPGRVVKRLDPAQLGAAIEELGTRAAAGRVMLVLRRDEMDQLRAPAAEPLRAFELVSVLPCPLEGRDDTLYVFRRVAE